MDGWTYRVDDLRECPLRLVPSCVTEDLERETGSQWVHSIVGRRSPRTEVQIARDREGTGSMEISSPCGLRNPFRASYAQLSDGPTTNTPWLTRGERSRENEISGTHNIAQVRCARRRARGSGRELAAYIRHVRFCSDPCRSFGV